MSTRRATDDTLVASLAGQLFDVMSMFPKRLVKTDELIHTFGMPFSQMQILELLEKSDMSIGQLSAYTGVAKPNVTPLVDALEERGFVARERKDGDRRMVYVHLTEEGTASLLRIREAVAAQIREWPVRLSRSELRSLDSSLATLIRVMNAFGNPQET